MESRPGNQPGPAFFLEQDDGHLLDRIRRGRVFDFEDEIFADRDGAVGENEQVAERRRGNVQGPVPTAEADGLPAIARSALNEY